MRFINKAGLLAGGLTALLILASCSDSDTSTGVTTGKQLANDASTEVVMHQGTAGTGEHSNPDTNHGHSPDQQHAEPNNPTTSSVVALLSISNPVCGNLTQEDGEQCDGGLGGNATCNTDCTLKTQRGEIIATAACGNGIVDSGEQCDDANDSNEDDCTRFCKTPVCGDGYVQGSNGEQCDDKNRIDTDSCNNACQSSTTTVVTTTTVIEEVNEEGGTTRTPTTTTTNTGGGTTNGGSSDDPVLFTIEHNPDDPVLFTIEHDPCFHDGCTCDYPDLIPNSIGISVLNSVGWGMDMTAPLPVGATVTYHCENGFELDVDETMTCTGTGVWVNEPPECVAEVVDIETNCTFPPIANSNHKSKVTYNIGEEWTYTCNPGFHLDGRFNSVTVQSNYCHPMGVTGRSGHPRSSCVADEEDGGGLARCSSDARACGVAACEDAGYAEAYAPGGMWGGWCVGVGGYGLWGVASGGCEDEYNDCVGALH